MKLDFLLEFSILIVLYLGLWVLFLLSEVWTYHFVFLGDSTAKQSNEKASARPGPFEGFEAA